MRYLSRHLDTILRAPEGEGGGDGAPPPAAEAQPAPAAPAPDQSKPTEATPSLLAAAIEAKPIDGEKPAGAAEPAKVEPPKVEGKEPPQPAEPAKVEGKEGEAKPAEAVPDEPIKYEAFKVPDNVKLDPSKLKAFEDIVGPAKVPQDVAQKIVDQYIQDTQDYRAQMQREQQDHWSGLQDTWKAGFRKDPELGGRREATTLATAKAVIEQYGGSKEQQTELLGHLNANGMGNFLGFIRLLNNVGKGTNVIEGGGIPASPTGRAEARPVTERWYGDTHTKATA